MYQLTHLPTRLAWLLLSLVAPSIALAQQSPYLGEPIRLPGTVQVEDFDTGGEGVAYHDSTSENEPGAYRTEGVDIELSEDYPGGGYDVGWVTPGEWLEYTVRVGLTGTYELAIRYASDGPGGTIHVEFDGIDKTGPIELPDTGGWQSWRTLRVPDIELVQDRTHIMRLSFDAPGVDGWLANFNWLGFTATQYQWPFNEDRGTGVPARLEAERFDRGGEGLAYHDSTPQNEGGAYRSDEAVDVEVTQDIGGGYDVGWVTPGEWLEYTLSFSPVLAGTYQVDIRYASWGFGGTVHLEMRDRSDNATHLTGPVALPDTGGWQTWRTVSVPNVVLTQDGVLRLSFDSPGPEGWLANINYLDLIHCGERSIARMIQAEHFNCGGEGVGYHDTTPLNEPGGYRANEGVDVELSEPYFGSNFDVGWIRPGEWLAYSVSVPSTRLYSIDIRYAADGYGGRMHMELDGVDITGPITLPDTGGWQTWQTITVPNVPLQEGSGRTLRVIFDEGNEDGWLANIDWYWFR